MTTYTYNISQFEFCTANEEQIINDLSRDYSHIFINGQSLEKIYKDMQITVNQENHIKKDRLSELWNKHCFTGADEKLLPYWEKFANALFHQGGLLYAFESALKEKMSMPENNSKAYIPEKIEKKVCINFNKQGLTITEDFTFTEAKDSSGDEENNLVAEKGSYLIKAQLLHRVSLIEKNGKLNFQHVIEQPKFECKNSELQKCLNRHRSIIDSVINLLNKMFQLLSGPNKASFFQFRYHTKIRLNDDNSSSNSIQGNNYTIKLSRN